MFPTWLGHWTFLCSFTSFFHFLSTSWLKAGRPGRAYFNWEGQHEQEEINECVKANLGTLTFSLYTSIKGNYFMCLFCLRNCIKYVYQLLSAPQSTHIRTSLWKKKIILRINNIHTKKTLISCKVINTFSDKLNLLLPFCHLAPGLTETSSWASLWAAHCWQSQPGGSLPPGPMLAAPCRWPSALGWPPSGPSGPRLPHSSGASG